MLKDGRDETGVKREGKLAIGFTSHVLFAFEYYKCIATMGFTLFVTLFMRMSVCDDPDLAAKLAKAVARE